MGNLASPVAQYAAEHNLCNSFQAFNTCYKDTGLWGVYFVTGRMQQAQMVKLIQEHWMHLCTGLTDFEVDRAKNALKTICFCSWMVRPLFVKILEDKCFV